MEGGGLSVGFNVISYFILFKTSATTFYCIELQNKNNN